jgi:hypothetical protein
MSAEYHFLGSFLTSFVMRALHDLNELNAHWAAYGRVFVRPRNYRTAGKFRMKFGTDVTLLGPTLKQLF